MEIATVKEFKDRVQIGEKVSTHLFWADSTTGVLYLRRVQMERKISDKNTVGFTLAQWIKDENRFEPSYCEWPKQEELSKIDQNTYSITETIDGKIYTKLIYKFL
jgi:hypothetical protein